ncbi:MAG: hypothetical protein EAZ99_04065 [Alphaproteobacteria bacterium]|nr:MAG: hypothetical protein EAZ99_04065 [Alphaproteobacteria bacterium]
MTVDIRMRYTSYGSARLSLSQAGGPKLTLSHVAFGDRGGAEPPHDQLPPAAMTALVNEVHRRPINAIGPHPEQAGWIEAQVIVPGSVGGWFVRELGLFDDTGTLAAVAYYPTTYKPVLADGGSSEFQLFIGLAVSSLDAVELIIDPSAVTASRAWVEALLAAHAASRNHPYATTEAAGFVELATVAETLAGADATKAVTPLALATALDLIEAALAAHDHPLATTTQGGFVRLADAAAIASGTAGRAVTADQLRSGRLAPHSLFYLGTH